VSSSEYSFPPALDRQQREESSGVGINCPNYWFSDASDATAKREDSYHIWNIWCDDNQATELYIPEGKEVFALDDCQGVLSVALSCFRYLMIPSTVSLNDIYVPTIVEDWLTTECCGDARVYTLRE
jgi:hypothetical protein